MRRRKFKYKQPAQPFILKNYLKAFLFSVVIILVLMIFICSFITLVKYMVEGTFQFKLMPLKDLSLIVIPFSLFMALGLYQDDK